jgi:6-pyruvoyltetrahydropterin/6-carboxytetrahydropterin synthase
MPMPFEICTTRRFSAAHTLRLPDGTYEPMHGHNWIVQVTVAADRLDGMGTVMDFHVLEAEVDKILQPMHNRSLNDLTDMADLNPSAENVAFHFARRLGVAGVLPAGVRLLSVQVHETDDNYAVYRP